ncbi:MAG TPA: peptide-methionine (R)-S-oxide reductase MsrB [Saprospiraceae bacterium]|nr:peptide-methionine (R)-S-oxide reductase MsrB [Saprospiraceae bacterium]
MHRLLLATGLFLCLTLNACLQSNTHKPSHTMESTEAYFVDSSGDTIYTVNKTDAEWKAQLDPSSYNVLRHEGTERPFTGKLNLNHAEGIYLCNACQLPLFSSKGKFDSGTGWPSFFKPIDMTHLREISDGSAGMRRVEVECRRCGGHLGHVFDDGPEPTGLRYCMNSVSLSFVEQ